MNDTPKDNRGWRILRRILIALAILATLIAIFYTEEDWRGKRAWENCKRELEAKGAVLDWNAYIPPPVPDDQNFFKATTNIAPWFVKARNSAEGELARRLYFFHGLPYNTNTTVAITNESVAREYLAWSDQFQSQFDELREALKRPYARIDGDYTQPFEAPYPNFVTTRSVAQTLAQRAKCYLLLNEPGKALREVTLLNDSRHLLERGPSGKSMMLVDAMVNVAITGLYVNTIANGLQSHAWHEPQLVVIQEQLKGIDLLAIVAWSFRTEQAAACRFMETTPSAKAAEMFSSGTTKNSLWQKLNNRMFWFLTLAPRGWIYQNMTTAASLEQKPIGALSLADQIIVPHQAEAVDGRAEKTFNHFSPYSVIAAIAVPNITKAWQTTSRNQTLVNEAQIVCALERDRLAHGEYPETLDALVPQFIEKLPHDIIGGQPLHYHRTADGKFLLYSVGWNETDDGGQEVLTKNGMLDYANGDWVWQYPPGR